MTRTLQEPNSVFALEAMVQCLPVHIFSVSYTVIVTRQQLGPEWVCLGLACSVCVLELVRERFCNPSPGDFESMFIKAGDSETRKGLG